MKNESSTFSSSHTATPTPNQRPISQKEAILLTKSKNHWLSLNHSSLWNLRKRMKTTHTLEKQEVTRNTQTETSRRNTQPESQCSLFPNRKAFRWLQSKYKLPRSTKDMRSRASLRRIGSHRSNNKATYSSWSSSQSKESRRIPLPGLRAGCSAMSSERRQMKESSTERKS